MERRSTATIDCQCHWYPPGFLEHCLARTKFPRCERDGDGYRFELAPESFVPMSGEMIDLELLFARMNADGVDVLVSSSEPLSVNAWRTEEAKEAARVLNEGKADAQRRYPGRFIGLATLPMQDPGAAIEELDHAIGELELGGVCVGSNINGSAITSLELLPLYKRIEELDVPLFLHPTGSIARDALPDYGLEYVIGYMFDTSVAALNLIFSRTLDECPRLKVVHPHLGATLPYLAGRIDYEYKTPWAGNRELPVPPSEYLRRRFYTDTVSDTPAALRMAVDLYGSQKVLFASDFPWWTAPPGLELVRSTLDERESAMVLGENAARLLRLATREGGDDGQTD